MAVTGWWVENPALFQRFDASFGLTLPAQLGVDAVAKHDRTFGLTLSPSLGFAASERYEYSFGLTLSPTLGFAATGTDGLILVGYAANDGNTVDLSGIDIEAGDRIIMFAYSVAAAAIPVAPGAGGTVPTYTQIDPGGGGDGNASKTFEATAGAGATSGTFTNTNSLIAVVLRNDTGIGGHAETGGSVGTAPGPGTYTSPSITQSVTDGTSIDLYFYGGENTASWSSPPAGFTRLISTADVCLNIKDDTTSDGAAVQTAASLVTGVGNFRSSVVEVLA